MRATTFKVYGNEVVEVFIDRFKDGFEIWTVGVFKGTRMVLGHHLTHDEVEALLEYAKPKDLIWRDALRSEIPSLKHPSVIETEESPEWGRFSDYDDPRRDDEEAAYRLRMGYKPMPHSLRTVAGHPGSYKFLGNSKTDLNIAKKAILGTWTDGTLTLTLEPEHRFRWSCNGISSRLMTVRHFLKELPDWWSFGLWCLHIMNAESKVGTRLNVLKVNERELHLGGGINTPDHPHRIAHVFQRVGDPPVTKGSRKRRKPQALALAGGPVSPEFRRLWQSILIGNPTLLEKFKPGMSADNIRNALEQANVTGDIGPLVRLYSWRNGMAMDDRASLEEISFFPEDIYQFLDLESAIEGWRSINKAAEQLQAMTEETEASSLFANFSGQLFPVFTDSVGSSIAVDLTPGKENRVVIIDFESEEPVREAYDSFEKFIRDVIRANEKRIHLSCFDE